MSDLPDLDLSAFVAGLQAVSPGARRLPSSALEPLHVHYRELCLWNRRLALIGPGTEAEALGRHYGESLAAIPFLSSGSPRGEGSAGDEADDRQPVLVDIGSGAGFPGWVLGAACPGLQVTLVEARQRKWAFLQSATRKAALPIQCLDARVRLPLPADLPEAIDWLTLRALRLPLPVLSALADRLRPGGAFLLWQGQDDPVLPPDLEVSSELLLPGSEHRRILRVGRVGEGR